MTGLRQGWMRTGGVRSAGERQANDEPDLQQGQLVNGKGGRIRQQKTNHVAEAAHAHDRKPPVVRPLRHPVLRVRLVLAAHERFGVRLLARGGWLLRFVDHQRHAEQQERGADLAVGRKDQGRDAVVQSLHEARRE